MGAEFVCGGGGDLFLMFTGFLGLFCGFFRVFGRIFVQFVQKDFRNYLAFLAI